MALSNPASDTAGSAISPHKAGLTSALGMLAMQDPSVPTPGKCHIDRCAVEIMIQVAESLGYKGLCSLARASKRYTEAAQDVLYRFVDLRPEDQNSEYLESSDDESTFDRPTKSALAVFLWTIKQKPHLATKVQDLWFLPRSLPVEYPQLMYSSVSPVSLMVKPGSYVVEVDEKKLACDLLARLTELRSLTITALDDYTCMTELDNPDNYGLPYWKDDGDRKLKLASWLGELTKTDFPDLERVEVVCSVGYGDDMGFKQRLEQSAEVRFLETIGVAVVVRKE
ncbi:hypothetical protein J4E85_005005 [Alternaria conjuncta]|uniref:uncharacterized protein n=1 Tax=Alternaria conjuncta TaxID=181017 RepID=UPI0022208274|nr:uncharacterized protein J4E85_005005 [Alternaria conjuncta]KAI4930378.1 hypothetical protein J4E85_005005 [Alternaria conjuncta]